MDPRSDALHAQRSHLPIAHQPYAGGIAYDARDPDATFPGIAPLRPPDGAPNVLVVLLDDVGFGASSAFGGPINVPTAERLADGGLKFNRFHTTALYSPTRQALLTGRDHHSVEMGGITEIATSAPGYSSIRPNSAAPLAETLKLNGYSTAQFGKCHEVPVWETSPMVPSTPGRPAAGASSISTALSAARPTSITRPSTRAPRPSSRTRRPKRQARRRRSDAGGGARHPAWVRGPPPFAAGGRGECGKHFKVNVEEVAP